MNTRGVLTIEINFFRRHAESFQKNDRPLHVLLKRGESGEILLIAIYFLLRGWEREASSFNVTLLTVILNETTAIHICHYTDIAVLVMRSEKYSRVMNSIRYFLCFFQTFQNWIP